MTGAAAREARPAVGLRAMYRRVVASEICDALERSTRQLAQPARLDADGLREDLGVVVQSLYMLLGYDPSGLEQLLVVAPAARAVAALAPAVEGARSSRHSIDNETQGFRYGQMGGLTAEQRQLLYWASRGPYEAMLEEDPAPPPVTDELAACADELDWLVPALAELGDGALARSVDEVARDLRTSLAAIPDLVAAVERFAVHRKAAPPDSDGPSAASAGSPRTDPRPHPDYLDPERTE